MNASISVVCYRSKTLANGQHPLMLQVSLKGKGKYQSLSISVHPDHWDFQKCKPKPSCQDGEYIQKIISDKILEVQKQILEYSANGKDYTPTGLLKGSSSVIREKPVGEFYRIQDFSYVRHHCQVIGGSGSRSFFSRRLSRK